jgi:hypothetical protein
MSGGGDNQLYPTSNVFILNSATASSASVKAARLRLKALALLGQHDALSSGGQAGRLTSLLAETVVGTGFAFEMPAARSASEPPASTMRTNSAKPSKSTNAVMFHKWNVCRVFKPVTTSFQFYLQ